MMQRIQVVAVVWVADQTVQTLGFYTQGALKVKGERVKGRLC